MNPATSITNSLPTPMRSTRRNPWPVGIVAFFAIFISAIATFITFAVRQRMDLVRPDYYAEELRYQRQMERVSRTGAMGGCVHIDFEPGLRRIRVALPPAHVQARTSGEIRLYRPSDARLDHAITLAPDADGVQFVDASQLASGYWKVRVNWSVGGEEYYFDQPLVITTSRS